MRGIEDLDAVCLTEVFKFLTPLDLSSVRHSCTKLKLFVDDYCRSLYFVREEWLDLRRESVGNVNRILNNFGRLVRRLKIQGDEETRSNLLPDVVSTRCGGILKNLSLSGFHLHEINIEKFSAVFDNLEILELNDFGYYDEKEYIENCLWLRHQYPNLTTLKIFSDAAAKILEMFFTNKRSIKTLNCWTVCSSILPLIVQNSAEIEELDIHLQNEGNLMSLAQLNKLKRLQIGGFELGQTIVPLIKQLSVNNKLEKLGIRGPLEHFTDDFLYALSNLTNLKKLQFIGKTVTVNDIRSVELLGQKLSKLESLMMVDYPDFPYRNFLASASKSHKFRTIYFYCLRDTNGFIKQMLKDFIAGRGVRGHRCLVSGDPLCFHLHKDVFNRMKEFLTEDNLQSIEKYENIKIVKANNDVFYEWFY